MNKRIYCKTLVVATLLPVLLASCATQEGNDQLKGAGMGALGGAALGCLTGLAFGGGSGCAKGAAIGATVGMVAGWGVVKMNQYQASQVRSAKDDQRLYGLAKSVSTPQVKINKGTSTPKTVKAGDSVKLSTDYSLQLPDTMSTAPVAESWTLKKDGKVLADLPAQNSQRSSGGWDAEGVVPIPKEAKPGTYVIEHKVKAGDSYDTGESTFLVSK